MEQNNDFKDINMFVDMIRRQLESQKNDENWAAEDEHLKCERELRKTLLLTEGVPVIKIIDIVSRNGFNLRFETQ